jgi:hypothetical protein
MRQEMRCRVCVGVVERGARFCPECGTRVSVVPPVFRSPGVVVAEARGRRVLWWCVSLVVMVAAVSLVVVYVMLRRGR